MMRSLRPWQLIEDPQTPEALVVQQDLRFAFGQPRNSRKDAAIVEDRR